MKILSIVFFLLAGGSGLLAISQIMKIPDPSIGEWFGTFVVPFLFGWWGKIAMDRASAASSGSKAPTPETHVRCPDCREFVFKDARVCKHCNAKLVPMDK